MRKQLSGFILVGFLMVALVCFGQPKGYPVKKINGIEYYQYTVQVSEGLFAIGRKFEVSPEEISKANPEIKNGLKVGQQILIPVQKKVNKNSSEVKTKIEFTEHVVGKKQTLFAISNKYNVSQEDIIKYNPEIKNGIHDGMTLRIPKVTETTKNKPAEVVEEKKPEIVSAKQPKTEKKNLISHIVEKDETLYSISRKYKVDVDDIIAQNPESATKLTIGTELKIPAKGINGSQKKDSAINTIKSTTTSVDVNKLFDSELLKKSGNNNKTIRIAFLLPFMLEQDKKDPGIDRFIDFYAGALLAIKEAKENGISFEIYPYDTEKSEEKLTEVLSNSELKTMDLIIGPAFSNQIPIISEFSKENRINTLIPFSSKVADIDTNPYLFQFNPGADTQLSFATELFTGKYKNMHITFVQIPGVNSMDEGNSWAEDLQKELKKANKMFAKVELGSPEQTDFSTLLKTGGKNLVIFNTDKFSYVSPYLKSLNAVSDEFKIILYEQYSWKNQSDKFGNGLYFSPFKSDLNPSKLSDYNSEFGKYFGKSVSKESPRFDLLGYDLSTYFITMIHKYGKKFTDKAGSYNFSEGIQSNPLFERISNGSGFVNQQLYLIED